MMTKWNNYHHHYHRMYSFHHMKELLEKEEGVTEFEHKIRVIEALATPALNQGKLKRAADMLLKRSKRAAFTSVITGLFDTLVSKFTSRLDRLSNDPVLASSVLAPSESYSQAGPMQNAGDVDHNEDLVLTK